MSLLSSLFSSEDDCGKDIVRKMATPNSYNPNWSYSRRVPEDIVNAEKLQSKRDSHKNRDDSSPLRYASSSSNDMSGESSDSPLELLPRSTPPTLTFTSAASLKVVVPHDDVPISEPSIKADTQQPQNEEHNEEQQLQQEALVVEQNNQKETAASSQQQVHETQAPSATPSTQLPKESERQIIKPLFFRPPPPVAPQAFKFAPRKLSQLKPPQPLTPSTQPASVLPIAEKSKSY